MSDWYQWIHNWYHWIQDVILEHAGEWWTYLIVSVLTWLDGFFPPLPSESLVIAMSSLSTTHGGPVRLWILIPLSMAGAYAGDITAYWIGRSVPRRWVVRGERGERTFTRAQKVMYAKGSGAAVGPLHSAVPHRDEHDCRGRPVSVPQVPDNRRHATTLWASFSVGIGLAAGSALSHNPLLGIITGVIIGVVFGWLLGKLGSWHLTRRGNNRVDDEDSTEL